MSIYNHFQHLQLSSDQKKALLAIETFLHSDESVFLLKGYAGTGKTTLLEGLCNYLNKQQREFYTMAPTGRAAMILNQKTSKDASTIHRHIYNMQDLLEDETTFQFYYGLNNNDSHSNCIYLIDEASMISDVYSDDEFFSFGSGHLLKDLFEYVQISNTNRKIIFIGDNAQLPPVDMNFSPALSHKYLTDTYNLNTKEITLKEVIRQDQDSGILSIATAVRDSIEKNVFNAFSVNSGYSDVSQTPPSDFFNTYKQLAVSEGINNTMVITHSNRQAYDYNNQIRSIRYGENLINTLHKKDVLLITRNNYNGPIEIFNGMFATVLDVGDIIYSTSPRFNVEGGKVIQRDLNFREVLVEMKDSFGISHSIKTTIIDNFLFSDNARLHPYDQRALYVDFKDRMRQQGIKPKTNVFREALKEDKYFNALQVKFGYAITCHKSQGGEWPNVMVDFKVFMGQMTSSYFRWAYTAITRAKTELNAIDAPHFNALNQFIIKDILPLNGIAANAFYIPNSEEDSLRFVEYRKERIVKLCNSYEIRAQIFEHANQLDITFIKGTDTARVQLYYKKNGFSKNVWHPCSSDIFKSRINSLLKQSLIPESIPFIPRFEFQNDLHLYLCDVLKEEEVVLTNVVQKEWCDQYYLQTDADCALLEFYFDKKHRYTYMQPKSTSGIVDAMLNRVIERLIGH